MGGQPSAATSHAVDTADIIEDVYAASTEPEDSARAIRGWARLVRHLRRIRRLQRIWAHLGQHLQACAGRGVREDLHRIFRP